MDEYLCLIARSAPAETEEVFKARLSAFWTHMLRKHEGVFEKVYAETSAFERSGDRMGRKYLVEADAANAVVAQGQSQGLDFDPIDEDEVYSKFEATPPEWFWIEH